MPWYVTTPLIGGFLLGLVFRALMAANLSPKGRERQALDETRGFVAAWEWWDPELFTEAGRRYRMISHFFFALALATMFLAFVVGL